MRAYLRPTGPIAAAVLLPADPGLAMTLAQALIDKPLMANHHHGLWGYSGETAAGLALTVQATGIGGPSAVAVLGELADLGARRAIRIGSCTAIDPALEPGAVVLPRRALAGDGASRALGATGAAPEPRLARALEGELEASAAAVALTSYDLAARAASNETRARWVAEAVDVVDLETAGLLALGQQLELAVAAALVVEQGADGSMVGQAELDLTLLRLGTGAARALGSGAGATAEPAAGVDLSRRALGR